MRSRLLPITALLLAICLCLAGCGKTVYPTFTLSEPSDLAPVENGTKAVTVSAAPSWDGEQWVLSVEVSMDVTEQNQEADDYASFGEQFTLEYLADGVWFTVEQVQTDTLFTTSDIGYTLSAEYPQRELELGLQAYGTYLYAGDYRMLTEIEIEGEPYLFSAEFQLNGENTISYS